MSQERLRFHFRAYGQAGGHDSGYVEALDRADAVRQLAQSGKVAYEIRPADAAVGGAGKARRVGLFQPRLDLTRFFSELSIILGSGFNIDVALKAVADAETGKAQKARIQAIHSLITEGKSVADAFAAQPDIPGDVVALIASGESSGRLDIVVAELARSYALGAQRRSEITEALLYPVFLVLVMLCALLILAVYLVPALEPIFDNAGAPPPWIVRALGAFGEIVAGYGFVMLAALSAGALLFLAMLRQPAARARLADLAARLPVAGAIMRGATRARYLNTMALLLGNGVPMLDAMNLAASTAACESHRARLLQARQRVSSGEALWQALKASDAFPEATLSLVRLGEESNNLGAMTARAGALTQAQMRRSVSRALTFLTPAITIALGALVGSLVISVMTTLLSINEIVIR